MNDDLTRYILDLEGRVAALSGMLGALIWVLNHRRILDKGLEQQIYRSTSDAIVTAHPEIEAAADRLILAMQQASCAAQPSIPDLGGTEP